MRTNPIIEAAKSKGNSQMQRIAGFVSKGTTGKIEIYTNLDMKTCVEIDEQDVIHIVESEKPTEPSIVFVRDQAPTVVHQKGTISSTSAPDTTSGCGCGGTSAQSLHPNLPVGWGGGTGNKTLDCLIAHAGCVLRCNNPDPLLQQGCLDSCAAAQRLCLAFVGGGGGIGGGPVLGGGGVSH